MILILAGLPSDTTVSRLAVLLRNHGADVQIVTPDILEQEASFSIATTPRGPRCVLSLPTREVDLRDVQAVWLWRGWRPNPLEARYRELAKRGPEWDFFEKEWLAFYKGFSLALAQHNTFCVNPAPFNTAFEEKCAQLFLAADVGLAIPPTLYTTRLGRARQFSTAHGNSLIYKPFHPYLNVPEPRDDGPVVVERLLTNRIDAADLVEDDDFIPTPAIFQPYVPKRLELRVVVVGRRLFACAIHSQESERSKDDWRRYDFANTPYRPYDLPVDVAYKIRRLMDRLGLVFGSVDLIVTPEGEHVFLEINPNGQFDFIVRRTGLPIYEHLAALLLARRIDYPSELVAELTSQTREVADALV